MQGHYHINIKKRKGVYIAEVYKDYEKIGYSQGENEQDICEMIADLIMTYHEVKHSRWQVLRRWVTNLFI